MRMANEKPQWTAVAYQEAVDAVSDKLARLRSIAEFPKNQIERDREKNLSTALAALRHERDVFERRHW